MVAKAKTEDKWIIVEPHKISRTKFESRNGVPQGEDEITGLSSYTSYGSLEAVNLTTTARFQCLIMCCIIPPYLPTCGPGKSNVYSVATTKVNSWPADI
jgi:hypothetical protein